MARRVQQPQAFTHSRGRTLMDTYRDEVPAAIQNNFTGGLKTEHTGLNFPLNSATDVQNCVFTMLGDVLRREGFDYEANYLLNPINRTNKAVNTYRWLNVGGDGSTQIIVLQVGNNLYFFESSDATTASPLSTQLFTSVIDISVYLAAGSTNDSSTVECQFSDGNGYLFVYHPYLDPFYVSYNAALDTVFANAININIRDFNGVPDGLTVTARSNTLSPEHQYNLINQGWTKGSLWSTTSTLITPFVINGGAYPGNNVLVPAGNVTFNIPAGLTINPGDPVNININLTIIAFATGSQIFVPMYWTGGTALKGPATVFSYAAGVLVLTIPNDITTGRIDSGYLPQYVVSANWTIASSTQVDLIDTWHTAVGNYPSNADVWWKYKDSTNVFNPGTTISEIPVISSQAPQGHVILNAFNQNRADPVGLAITPISTLLRPRTGAWFQGRVWYAGIDASSIASGDEPYYTWTENIYFSQVVSTSVDFGACYQQDDPTDENLFNLLPTDGGVIVIQGCGPVYKLYPIQNGMLVFAANGIWFITGSTGIGFAANDYTITKISSVQSISSTSFIDIQGLPIFWNQEGIYTVTPAQQGLGLTVNPLTLGTILSFYNNIPLDSKKYVRGAYNPITYIVQWIYKGTQETDITSRYQFDSVLCFNVYTKAFYTYNIGEIDAAPFINGITYVANPGGSAAPAPTFKYLCSVANAGTYNFTFAEEKDTSYVDWKSFDGAGVNFTSYFVTGYDLAGQGLRKWNPDYVYVFSRNLVQTSYKIQGIWDWGSSGDSGQYSVQQTTATKPYYGMLFRRHRIRGHGYVFQLKITSVDGQPFDIMGWAMWSTMNAGV